MKNKNLSRRDFISKTAATAAAFTIVPSTVFGKKFGHVAPSDKLNIAGVGVGGMGRGNLRNMNSENIVALCDVDMKYAKNCFNDYPNAKVYKDFRVMYEEMGKSIDAVMIATPDHTHAIAAATAMAMGKHVYVQKPLTHSVYESRLLTMLAKKHKVATQMGNQGSSSEDVRTIIETVWSGQLGDIEEVHCYTNRPIWPQGLNRPEKGMWVPEDLDWDLFIGPANMRPFHEIYTPWNWRGWWDFGLGALGDMACHIMYPAFVALDLKYPSMVQGSSSLLNMDCAPTAEKCQFIFPARKASRSDIKIKLNEVKINWYDGGLLPDRPVKFPNIPVKNYDFGNGTMIIGTKDTLYCKTYGDEPVLASGNVIKPNKVLKRVELSHEQDWIAACKETPENRRKLSSDFEIAGPFNEMVVMGAVSVRLQALDRILNWDAEKMEFSNISPNDMIKVVTSDHFEVRDGHPHFDTKHAELNALEAAKSYIKHDYRKGWTLPEMPKL